VVSAKHSIVTKPGDSCVLWCGTTVLQAGLSWSTILAKRQAYRTAFEGFNPKRVAAFDDRKVQQLLAPESGVVRHKGKLQGAVTNAK
jgi:DNA-3-methyladenine glycosylase I